MKTKEIEALESYFETENEYWNSYCSISMATIQSMKTA